MDFFWKALDAVADKLKIIGALGLAGMTVLTCTDVVGRFFKHPVFGSVELVTFMGVMAVAASLPAVHLNKGHIGVELLFRFFSRRTRAVIDSITGVLSLILFGLLSWRMFDYAMEMRASGEVSMNLGFPEYMLVFVVAVCFGFFFLAILKGIRDSFVAARLK